MRTAEAVRGGGGGVIPRFSSPLGRTTYERNFTAVPWRGFALPSTSRAVEHPQPCCSTAPAEGSVQQQADNTEQREECTDVAETSNETEATEMGQAPRPLSQAHRSSPLRTRAPRCRARAAQRSSPLRAIARQSRDFRRPRLLRPLAQLGPSASLNGQLRCIRWYRWYNYARQS